MSDQLPSVNVNIGEALPFLWEKVLQAVGRDTSTKALRLWFSELHNSAYLRAATIQCVGMHTPLPMDDLYRPTKLFWQISKLTIPIKRSNTKVDIVKVRKELKQTGGGAHIFGKRNPDGSFVDERIDISLPERAVNAAEFLNVPTSAIITAGPGWGKTTFLHFLFLSHIDNEFFIPILISLGKAGSLRDLIKLRELASNDNFQSSRTQFLLLVDGYDEVSTDDRKSVSDIINSLVATESVRAYVACREFYDVFDLKFPQVRIAEFDHDDQKHYARAFMSAYGSKLSSDAVLAELRQRGLDDLLQHPLLLALVCIVKSGAQSVRSKNVLDLIQRALDSLSFRWDEWKGIDREQSTPLDGRARMHCLMRAAHLAEGVAPSEKLVMQAAREQLDKYKWEDLDEKVVMLEIARFFGILVPTDNFQWRFVHRTLYDYLAACFITENGGLQAWNKRMFTTQWAYAACRSGDATDAMKTSLNQGHFEVFIEMLSNEAPFNHETIANALLDWYRRNRGMTVSSGEAFDAFAQSPDGETYVRMGQPFLHLASTKFLHFLAEHSSESRGKGEDTFLAYSLAELRIRKVSPSQTTLANLSRKFRRDEELYAYIESSYHKVLGR